MADLITVDELYQLGTTPEALKVLPLATVATAISAASALATSSLLNRYDPPIVSVGLDVKVHVASLAAYFALTTRGRNPDMASDDLRDRYKDAIKWFSEVGDGRHKPSVIDTIPLVENDDAIEIVLPRGRNAWR